MVVASKNKPVGISEDLMGGLITMVQKRKCYYPGHSSPIFPAAVVTTTMANGEPQVRTPTDLWELPPTHCSR